MIAAVVLAAGESRRMGRPKLILPWGNTTVIGEVVSSLRHAGLEQIVVVTNPAAELIEHALQPFKVTLIVNSGYAQGGMLSSLQMGIRAFEPQTDAGLVVLGDQPQMRIDTVRALLDAHANIPSPLLVPSFHDRRGHPWLIARDLWPALLSIAPPQTPRDFLNAHADQIRYLQCPDDSILRDLDTPDDYARDQP